MHYSRKAFFAVASALGWPLLAAHPVQAQVVTYSGVDQGAVPGNVLTNSNTAAANFDTAVGGLGTESLLTFESAPVGAFTGLYVAPGVTMLGTSASGGSQLISNVTAYPPSPALAGYSTTPGGSEYANISGGAEFLGFTDAGKSVSQVILFAVPAVDAGSGWMDFRGEAQAKRGNSVAVSARFKGCNGPGF